MVKPMINPYEAPKSLPAQTLTSSGEDAAELSAEFQLTQRDLRRALARFVLSRRGGRLTVLSLVMIALAIATPQLIVGSLQTAPANDLWIFFVLAIVEVTVMAIATVSYQAVIWGLRNRTLSRLAELGVVAGATGQIDVLPTSLRWTGSTGRFEFDLDRVRGYATDVGMLLLVDQESFLVLPRSADFGARTFEQFKDALIATLKR